MKRIEKFGADLFWPLWGSFAVLVLSLRLVIYSGFSPGVVPDELSYMRQAFFRGGVGYGNYLFDDIFGLTSMCGDSWYGCVRGINTLFDLGFAVVISLVVLRLGGTSRLAASAGLVSYLAAFIGYGGFFMPDTMFAFFTLLTFYFLVFSTRLYSLSAMAAGLALGAALLIKPHALALVVGILVYAAVLAIWRPEGRIGLSPLALLGIVATGLAIRLFYGLLAEGLSSINFFARYSFVEVSQALSDPVSRDRAQEFEVVEAIISFLTNILPVVAVTFIILLLTGIRLKLLLAQSAIQIALVFVISFGVLSSLFGGYLELVALEETMFRTLTRYWEFSIPLLLVAALTANTTIDKESDELIVSNRERLGVYSVAIVSACLLILIPRTQTQADSSLLHMGNWSLVIVLGLGLLLTIVGRRASLRREASLLISFAAVGLVSLALVADFQTSEKAGTALGLEIREILKQHPEDMNRFVFVGEPGAANTAALIGKLPSHTHLPLSFYNGVDEERVGPEARWVAVSREVHYAGAVLSKKPVGDMILYERSLPYEIPSWRWDELGVLQNGKLIPTYWGSWVVGREIEFTVPTGATGDILEIRILANEKLVDTTVEIEFNGRVETGQLIPGQVLTPISLIQQDGQSWSGTDIIIRYIGDGILPEESNNGYLIGLSGLKTLNARE